MLDQFAAHATLAVSDMGRAKTWYAEKLGLLPVSEDPGEIRYESGGSSFILFPTPHAGTAKNTVMEWTVDDVEKEVTELKSRGVSFDTSEEMEGVEWSGDIAMMGDNKAAWFTDSEGNILAITQ